MLPAAILHVDDLNADVQNQEQIKCKNKKEINCKRRKNESFVNNVSTSSKFSCTVSHGP